jgi:hypothetical protein
MSINVPARPMFPREAPVPGVEDETGAGSDFYVWDNILPESAGQAHNMPSPMSVIAPGIETSLSLASRLHWRPVRGNAHPQTWLSYQGRSVPIDIDIAPVIEALWQAGYPTLACCEGDDTETESAYIMFAEPVAKQFMDWVHAHEQWLPGDLTRRFEIIRQVPDEWYPYMQERYPLIEDVECRGGLYTIVWRFHRQDSLDYREQLVALLRAK